MGTEMAFSDISEQNGTQTPLGSSETFTGAAEFSLYPDIMVVCYTDAPGTLYIDFSTDEGRHWDSTLTFDVAAGSNEFHTAVKGPRSIRTRLVNGTTAQTVLRLMTAFGTFRQGNLPLSAGISADADASVVRSVSTEIDLAFGRIGGQREDSKFGVTYDVDTTSNAVDVWHFSSGSTKLSTRSDEKHWPATGGTLYMASDSASDTDIDLAISYIDDDGYAQDLSFNYTAGTTGASLGVSGLDINRVKVSGATLNVGNLYFAQTNTWTAGAPNTPSDVIAFVYAGYGQTEQAAYRVPIDKKVRLKQIIAYLARASGAAGSAELHLLAKEPGGSWVVKRDFQITDASPINKRATGLVFAGGTLLRMRIEDVSDNDTNLTGEFHFDEVDA